MSGPSVNEEQRLEALRRYELLDTPPEESFDAIVRLSAQICKTPVSLITLVDEARQWFKARVGFNPSETPRDIAFCAHAIQGRELCLIPDALVDERFRNNPLVLEDPKIRFYAAVPLTTMDGHALGTLCVIDTKPRADLSEHQRECLHLLARETMTQFELRRALKELEQTKRDLENTNIDLDAFGAAVAHDLRAPLRNVEGFLAILEDQVKLVPESRQQIYSIHNACTRMREIIDALLRLSRVSNAELKRSAVNLSQLVSDLCEELRQTEPLREFVFTIAPDIVADADAELMRVALTNLLSNASKFSRVRQCTTIEFGRLHSGSGAEYFLRDNGIGFDSKVSIVPPVPFARLHPKADYEGVGLGLTIVQRVISRHNGILRAVGRANEGVTFIFTLGEKPKRQSNSRDPNAP